MADAVPSTAGFTPAAIARAHDRIAQYVNRTPLMHSEALDAAASAPFAISGGDEEYDTPPPPPLRIRVFLKCENLQRTGAFKARGAFHAVTRLVERRGLEDMRRAGVVTVSSGNHAQGLALAAVTFGIPAVIVMPRASAQSKIAGVRRILGEVVGEAGEAGEERAGGRIVFCGSSNEEKKAAAAEAARQTGGVFVPPYDDADVILGQGTCAKELAEQFAEQARPGEQLHAVLAPLGGGGLLGGVATWFGGDGSAHSTSSTSIIASHSTSSTSNTTSQTSVFGVEPSFEGADDARRGLSQQPQQRIAAVASTTNADGLRTPVGVTNWEIVRDPARVAGVFAVGEDHIRAAMRLMFEQAKLVVEPSGCVPLAAVLFSSECRRRLAAVAGADADGTPTVNVALVLSGGNTTMEAVASLFPVA